VAVAADSGNGISAVLDFARYLFVNSDLTINLLRCPQGEWICVDARTLLAPNGCGLAESQLFDEAGLVGRATQSLAVRAGSDDLAGSRAGGRRRAHRRTRSRPVLRRHRHQNCRKRVPSI
jgi:hypothetical protein